MSHRPLRHAITMLAICGISTTCNALSAKAADSAPDQHPSKQALTEKQKKELARKDNEKARYVYHHAWWMIRETFYDKEYIRTHWSEMEHKFDDKLSTDRLHHFLKTLTASTSDPFTSIAPSKNLSKHVCGHEYGVGANLGSGGDVRLTTRKGSPAHLACIPAGAVLKTIDGQAVNLAEKARTMLRGAYRSKVRIGFKYGDETQKVLLRRTFKEVRAVRDCRLLPENVVYIRLGSFQVRGCAQEIKDCLKKYPDCRAVVLDLRDNCGGYLQEAVEVTRLFVDRGTFTAEKQKRPLVISVNGKRSPYKKLPVILAMNYYSASASELVAGCLRDLSNAQIIGERSFGKGVGQYQRLVNKDWLLAVSGFRIKLPSGECVHARGLSPTINAVDEPQDDEDGDTERLRRRQQRVANTFADRIKPLPEDQTATGQAIRDTDEPATGLGCVGKESCAAITIRRSANRADGPLAAELRLAYAKLGIPTDAEGIELPELYPVHRF